MKPMKTTAALAAAWTVLATLALPAGAQDGPIRFRMAAVAGNPSNCIRYDSTLSRVHTLTVAGDKATLKSAGGVNETLKQTVPKVYKTTSQLGGAMLAIVADASKSPRTLTITETNLGCHWTAIAP